MTSLGPFTNDTELSIFLWRFFAPEFDNKVLVLDANALTIASLEKAIGQTSQWRITDGGTNKAFSEALSGPQGGVIKTSIEGRHFSVDGERENGWLEESMAITISSAHTTQIERDCGQEINLICCVLAAAVDQKDLWSTTQLLQALAPETLPVLKRLAIEKRMNIVQTLFSYTMEAAIQGNSGPCPVLSKHIGVLSALDKTVDQLHDHMHTFEQPRNAVNAMVQSVANFLLNIDRWRCSSKVKTAQRVVISHLKQLDDIHKLFKSKCDNTYQVRNNLTTRTTMLVRSLLDRMTIANLVPPNSQTVTPLFKTPQVAQISSPTTSIDSENAQEQATPKAIPSQVASFLNNGTPTPIRKVETAVDQFCDSGFLEESLEYYDQENKENIDPNQYGHTEVGKKDTTPKRTFGTKLQGLRVRDTNSNAGTKRSFKPSSKAPTSKKAPQKTLLSFFNNVAK